MGKELLPKPGSFLRVNKVIRQQMVFDRVAEKLLKPGANRSRLVPEGKEELDHLLVDLALRVELSANGLDLCIANDAVSQDVRLDLLQFRHDLILSRKRR